MNGSPAANATSVTYTVSFDENANNVSVDDFILTTAGSASGNVANVSASSGSSVTVTINSISGNGTIRLDLLGTTNITDDAGNGNGTNGNVAAYTSGSTHTVSMIDNDGNLTAAGGVSEPIAISSTVDTVGESTDVFDFTLSDGGTADGQTMTVSQIVINVSGTSIDSERAKVTWRLNGNDASNVSGAYSSIADTITFSGLSISIADGASEIYTVNAYYNDNTALTDKRTFILSVDGDTDVTVGSGTQMSSTSAVTNSTGSTVDISASELAFTTQPVGSTSGSALTTQPMITARDAFGNTDTDFAETITLTESSAGSITNNSVVASSSVATFSGLTYTATADQQSFTLTANDQDGVGSDLPTSNANAVTSDVVATQLVFDTQPAPLSVNSGAATSFSTVPVVSARDTNGVIDTGYSTDIILAEVNGAGSALISGTGDTDGSGATVSISPSAGIATFTAAQITYTASGGSSENFNLQASSGGLSTANSSQLTGLTADSDGDLTAATGVTEPQSLNYTIDTLAEARGILDFTLSDGGSGDTLAMGISSIVLNASGTTTDADRAKITYILNGPDASDVVGTYSAVSDTITFSPLTISIADAGSETYELKAYFNDNTEVTHNSTLILSVDGDTDITISSGSQMGTTAAVTNAAGTTINDDISPIISVTTAVTTPSNDTTPTVVINSSETADITIGGDTGCGITPSTFSASTGDNSLTLNTVTSGTYNCTAVATDAAGNTSSTVNLASFEVDTTQPGVAIQNVPTNTNAAFTTTFEFNKDVTGFTLAEITVGNGAASSFNAVDGNTYTALITPAAAGNVTIDISAAVATDSVGNNNTAATQAVSNFDATRPSVQIQNVPTNSSAAFTTTFEFDENVTGFALGDITVGNGTASAFTAVDANTYTALITPTADGNVTLDIAESVATDAAGNNSTAAAQAVSSFDSSRPTVAIQGAPTSATADFNISIEFSESVTGFIVTDIQTSNATLSNFSGSGTTYTATVSIDAQGPNVTLSVPENIAQDTGSNNNTASSVITVTTNTAGVASISGITAVGQTLTASVTDADGISNASFSYQWISAGFNVGTESTYTLQKSDIGNTITVDVSYNDDNGNDESLTSAATSTVVSAEDNALSVISTTAGSSGSTEPTVEDYLAAGVTGVDNETLTRILPLINTAVANQASPGDVDEASEIQALVDTILEGQDDDGDGLPNFIEGNDDTDGDSITNRNDTDSDNDGIADSLETRLNLEDTDNDGIIDVLDADIGNDEPTGADAGKVDANFDGVDDKFSDLAALLFEMRESDFDNDDIANHLDLDSDNDGVTDITEAGLMDSDANAQLDDGESIVTEASALTDTDANGIPDFLSLMSDGIVNDMVAAGLPADILDENNDGILDSTIDMDRDGLVDVVDNAIGAFGSLPDIDGDGIPNHLDDDDDGDGIPDIEENPFLENYTGLDIDADGIDDGVDYDVFGVINGEDSNGNGIQDAFEADSDGDGISNELDATDDRKKPGSGAMGIEFFALFLACLLLASRRRPILLVKKSIR